MKDENVPDNILSILGTLKDTRFKSPKEFKETLKAQLKKKELDRYGLKIMDYSLDYRLRSKIQITISDETGNPAQGTFRVGGIYKTSNTSFDQAAVFVDSRELAGLYGGTTVLVHEIALLLNDIENVDSVKEKLTGISPG